jgi:hypothetical protein
MLLGNALLMKTSASDIACGCGCFLRIGEKKCFSRDSFFVAATGS